MCAGDPIEGSWHLELIDVPKCSPLRLKWVFLAVFGRGGLQFEHSGVLAALRYLPGGPEVTDPGLSLADRLSRCG